MTETAIYPEWVCNECGVKYGAWYSTGKYAGPSIHYATYHIGFCDVCSIDNIAVTEPRDFGCFLDWDVTWNQMRDNSNKSKKPRKTRKKNIT